MNALGGLLVVLAAWLGGRALLPGRAALPRSAWEEQGVAWLLGSAALAVAAMALAWLGLRFTPPVAWSLLGLAALAGGWRVWRERRAPLAPSPLAPWQFGVILFLGLGAAALALAWPLNEFDPILHFALKAKLLWSGVDPGGEAFSGLAGPAGRVMTHPSYPLGIPFLEAFAAHAGGGWDERWVQAPLALWSVALPAAVALGLRGFGPAAARAGALAAACTPALYVQEWLSGGWERIRAAGLGEEKMLGGRGDLPVMALFGCGVALLLAARRATPARTLALLAGLALAGAASMKNEGLGLLGVLAIALALAALLERGRGARTGALALAAAALALAPWLLHRAQLPQVDENYTAQLGVERIGHFLREDETDELSPIRAENYGADWTSSSHWRPARIARYFGLEVADLTTWGLLWPLAALGALAAWRRRPELRWLALVVLGGFALYALILLVTPWFLPALHKKGIPGRLLLHLVGPAALLAGALFAGGVDRAEGRAGLDA